MAYHKCGRNRSWSLTRVVARRASTVIRHMLESIAFALTVNVIKSKTKFIFCALPNTQKWKMIFFIVSSYLLTN